MDLTATMLRSRRSCLGRAKPDSPPMGARKSSGMNVYSQTTEGPTGHVAAHGSTQRCTVAPSGVGAPVRVAAAQRRWLGSGTAATGRRNGPSALPLQNETAPDRLVRSPGRVEGRSMEPSREVEAWVESYFCSSVLLALAA